MSEDERLPHLRINREEWSNPRRTKPGFSSPPPADIQGHAKHLKQQLGAELQLPPEVGFDPRRLLKLRVNHGMVPEAFESISGLKVISQEDREILVMFADEFGLQEFRRRLDQLERGELPTRKDILFAIKGIEGWTPEDRTGSRLNGIVDENEPFLVDAELWALESLSDRSLMISSFKKLTEKLGVSILDELNRSTIVLFRLKVSKMALNVLLDSRDVRMIEAPPKYQFETQILRTDISALTPIDAPPEGVPGVVVLDSGVATGHPLLGPAIGDAQSFLPGSDLTVDENGHGTMVAGLALYGDVQECIDKGDFVPLLRIFSARITDKNSSNNTGFVENNIVQAVYYFTQHYGCRVFNLSFGDINRPYTGGHVDALAAVIDSLSQELGVLFIVSAGNFHGTEEVPNDWLREYPDYLFSPLARIIDPAPALNALTVGSLARYDQSYQMVRFPGDVDHQPIARKNQPSPFTRTGPGPLGAIKPEIVDYGGNLSVSLRRGVDRLNPSHNGLGEVSTSLRFAQEGLFGMDVGTSFAAPKIANLAATLLKEYPEASSHLLRALIVAHARPEPSVTELFSLSVERAIQISGYGRVDKLAVLGSGEQVVTLMAEEEVVGDAHHFFEIPLPDDFFLPGRWTRSVTVALAHSPIVRRTRLTYKGSSMSFKVVKEPSLDRLTTVFKWAKKGMGEPMLNEYEGFSPKADVRSRGTVQAATRQFKSVDGRWGTNKLFVVVTHHVEKWAETLFPRETYALVVTVRNHSEEPVRFYSQIKAQLQTRGRIRV